MDSQTTPSIKLDVYELVTNRIIELLEAGTIPWRQPWTDAGIPMNLISKRPYRGINLWLLLSLNYERNLFLTWEQLKKIGGSVNQGQHGHIVLFWKQVSKKPEELDGSGKPKQIPMLRYYKVFNIEQCRDIPQNLVPELTKEEFNPIERCEAIVSGMPDCPPIRHKEQKAFYHIGEDFINMPKKKSFSSPEGYYATLFHELVHSTGAEKRLNRPTVTEMAEFGSDQYSIEELIAELGSAYLCAISGILDTEMDNSAAYIHAWLTKLQNDKRFVVQASGLAQKVVDYILKERLTKEEEVEGTEV